MKKTLSAVLLGMFLFGSVPSLALATESTNSGSAASLQALMAQISSLLKIVEDLQKQLASLQKQTIDYSIDERISLVENMYLGSKSEQVKVLQALLAADAELYPEALITGYYGPATEAAVKRFQKKHGIESLGVVGPKTRAKCNEELEKKGLKKYDGEVKVKYEDDDDDDNDWNGKKKVEVKYEHKFCIPPGHAVAPGWKKKNGNVDYYLIPFCNENGNGQGTGTSTKDITPPTLSNISVSGITPNTATITWTTNELATSDVKYGTSVYYTNEKTNDHNFVTSHSVTLTGLASSTLYHFQVRSRDAVGNKGQSSDMTFTTTSVNAPDTTAPTISNIVVSNLSMTGATVSWNTNENATSQIEYGTSASLGSFSTQNNSFVTSHSQTLTGLTASTTYHYRVRSQDAAGNLGTSSIGTFNTNQLPADTTAPNISGISVTNIGQTGATISWSTDETSDSQVGYGTTAGLGLTTTLDTGLVMSHSQGLTGLVASTTYHFHVRSKDAAGNLAVSSSVTFTTLPVPPDVTGPVLSAVTAGNIGSTTATITWTTNENASSKVYYGTTDPLVLGSASFMLDAALLTAHSLGLTGLTASTTYFYVVESADLLVNLTTGTQLSFTTGN